MSLAKLSSKSQVVLPAKIRRKLGINPGDLLQIDSQDDAVVIRKAPESYVDALEHCGGKFLQGAVEKINEGRDEWDK